MERRLYIRGYGDNFAFFGVVGDELQSVSRFNILIKLTHLHLVWIAFDHDIVIPEARATVPQLLAL
jgi:hypothetical protein